MIYTAMTKKALKLCFEAHCNQTDKSGMPYDLTLHSGELADMFIAIADGTAKEKDLLDWITRHLR